MEILGVLLCFFQNCRIGNVGLHKEAAQGNESLQKTDQGLKSRLSFHACGKKTNIQGGTCGKLGKIIFAVGTNDCGCALLVGIGRGRTVCGKNLSCASSVCGRETVGSPFKLTTKGADSGRELIAASAVERIAGICKIG